jgi:serine/threonine protein phosphatase PrpC
MSEKYIPPEAREKKERGEVYPYRSWQLLGGRSEQQDASDCFIIKNEKDHVQVHLVADGHGEGGGYFAGHTVWRISEALKSTDKAVNEKSLEPLLQEIQNGFDGSKTPGGTTLSVTMLRKGSVSGLYLGDSETRLVGEVGSKTLFKPHRLNNNEERERLEAMDAPLTGERIYVGNSGINLTRALGDVDFTPYVSNDPERFHQNLRGNKYGYLIAGSDGFWEVYDKLANKEEISDILVGKDLEEVSDKLKSFVQESNPTDNVTVHLVKLK